jgi:trehalose synthase-fused probable maltokinase
MGGLEGPPMPPDRSEPPRRCADAPVGTRGGPRAGDSFTGSEALGAWMARQRWFARKTRQISAVSVEDRVPLGPAAVVIVVVEMDDGGTDRYAIPLLTSGKGSRIRGAGDRASGAIVDALDDRRFGLALLDLIGHGRHVRGDRGELRGVPTRAFPRLGRPPENVHRLGGEQSNTSIAFGDQLILKHFRRLVEGPNPEEEMGRFLTERSTFRNTPRLAGHVEYRGPSGGTSTLAVVHELVAGARDGWEWMLGELGPVFDRARGAGDPTPAAVRAIAGPTLTALSKLGHVTGELHRALAADWRDPAFAPEPITASDVAAWTFSIEAQLRQTRALAGDVRLPAVHDMAEGLVGLARRYKIRHHGDYHLGQTLFRPGDGEFLVVDFEGEPSRPVDERRRKHTPLRDVAGMLRSIDYAAAAAMSLRVDTWVEAWRAAAGEAFIHAYRATTTGSSLVPESESAFRRAVAVLELEKAAYEVVYEANHRPDWLSIPRAGLERAAAAVAWIGRAGAA